MRKLTAVMILAVIAMAVLNIVYEPPTVADVFYPIANQRISWEK